MNQDDDFNFWAAIRAVGVMAAILLLVTIGFLIFSSHGVRRYYVGNPSEHGAKGICVMAEVNWDQDDVVYCTDDMDKAIAAMTRLNFLLEIAPGRVSK